jgi:Zn-dependent peptidase ImmA (M78 family)
MYFHKQDFDKVSLWFLLKRSCIFLNDNRVYKNSRFSVTELTSVFPSTEFR